MKRTISVMLGKGSFNHNSRKFKASNIDSERTQFNVAYRDEPIKEVYHKLFDDAVKRYNEKQTRSDRCISDYNDKIRTGKQEKLFYEVILQVGNKDDMAATTEGGQLAAKVLDEYMKAFEQRNPNFHVFSAHLHMDEATPHLHLDFVPFTTGSKRGLDTRVSLKQALAAQGFAGGTRGDTEWSQWVRAEKEQLSQVMERHGMEWTQLGTHDEHLSVIDFKKMQRVKEVAALEETITEKQGELDKYAAKLEKVQDKLEDAHIKEQFIADNARQYDDAPEFQLPEPKSLMSAKIYHEKVAAPLVEKLKTVIHGVLLQYFDKMHSMQMALNRANGEVAALSKWVDKYETEMPRLQAIEKDYTRLRRGLGKESADRIIQEVKEQEVAIKKKPTKGHEYVR